jgi:hypothetical protein
MNCERCGAEGAISMCGIGGGELGDDEVELGPWLCVACLDAAAYRGEPRLVRPRGTGTRRANRKRQRQARKRGRRAA